MKPLAALLIATAAAFAQPLKFDVASIRPSAPTAADTVNVGLRMDGQQAHINSLPLAGYIGIAYQARPTQITGPDWLVDTRYDIAATLPGGSNTKQIPEMLQGLLTERFGFKFHREQKEFPVYALVLGTRPLALTPVTGDVPVDDGTVNVTGGGSSAGVAVDLGGGASYTFANNKLTGKKLDMDTLVSTLESYMDRPIVNKADLKGFYDITFEITPEDYRVMLIRAGKAAGIVMPPQALRLIDGATTPSLFDAIEKLGLKLEPRRLPLEVIVVDQISKTPSEN
jgi:uncharacterized protein (TIGR03435 family)